MREKELFTFSAETPKMSPIRTDGCYKSLMKNQQNLFIRSLKLITNDYLLAGLQSVSKRTGDNEH